MTNISELLRPKSLDYYRALVTSGADVQVSATLTVDQAAAVLKAHDHGILAMGKEELTLLDQVMSVIKQDLWP